VYVFQLLAASTLKLVEDEDQIVEDHHQDRNGQDHVHYKRHDLLQF
jgi:hypothetical protein